MKKILVAAMIAVVLAGGYLSRPANALCEIPVLSCYEEDKFVFTWESFDGSCWWDTIIDYSGACMSYEDSDTITCDNSSSCYVEFCLSNSTGVIADNNQTISCGVNVCMTAVGEDVTVTTSSDDFCCDGSTCTTDCD